MKFLFLAALVAVAAAIPEPEPHYLPPTYITTHAKTIYAPLTQTNYGSHVNHLVPVPAPIYKGVPQPYPVPVPQPYEVPRPVPVTVPRPVPVEVPRPIPIPLVAQAAPIVTKSVVHATPVVHHAVHPEPILDHSGPGPYIAGHGYEPVHGALGHGLPLSHYRK